jgi:sulfur carrier protein
MNDAIHVHLNGMPCRLVTGITLAALLDAEGLARRRIAVEVNGEIVSRGRHAQYVLADGDKVEIVHALGGG